MTRQSVSRFVMFACAICCALAAAEANAFCVYNKTKDATAAFYEQAKVVTSTCEPGHQFDSGLCYDNCRENYGGAGPVCWGNCPSGWVDHGAGCTKPAAYGRGGGYPWKFGDALNDGGMYHRCEEDHGRDGCEKDGAIVYPKCKSGYHKVGCCLCSPDCPSGFNDTGATCTKPTYGRGAGVVPRSNLFKSYQAESIPSGGNGCCNWQTRDCNPDGQATSEVEFQVHLTSRYASGYIECFTGSYSAVQGNQQQLPKIEAGGWLDVVDNPKFDASKKKYGSDNPPYLVQTYRTNGQSMGSFTCPGYAADKPGLMDFF